jgi:hypothetical protein
MEVITFNKKSVIKDLLRDYLEDTSIIDTYWCVIEEMKNKFDEKNNFVILELRKLLIVELKEKFQRESEIKILEDERLMESQIENEKEADVIQQKKKFSFKKKILKFFSCFCCFK